MLVCSSTNPKDRRYSRTDSAFAVGGEPLCLHHCNCCLVTRDGIMNPVFISSNKSMQEISFFALESSRLLTNSYPLTLLIIINTRGNCLADFFYPQLYNEDIKCFFIWDAFIFRTFGEFKSTTLHKHIVYFFNDFRQCGYFWSFTARVTHLCTMMDLVSCISLWNFDAS